MFFHASNNDKVQSKSVKILYLFLEPTHPEMQRKHTNVPIRYSFGFSLMKMVLSNVNQHSTWLMVDIKHQPKLYMACVL